MVTFYIIEACICAVVFVVTKDIFILNILLMMFAGLKCCLEFIQVGTISRATGIISSVMTAASLATIYYHNPIFLKWKALMLVFIVSIFILVSPKLLKRPATYYITKKFLILTKREHASINYYTAMLGLVLAVLNLLVSKKCTDEQWLFFKTILSPILILVFFCVQIFIYRNRLKCIYDKNEAQDK